MNPEIETNPFSDWNSITEKIPAVGDIIACAAEHQDGGMMFWAGEIVDILQQSFAVMKVRSLHNENFVLTYDTLWVRLPDIQNHQIKCLNCCGSGQQKGSNNYEWETLMENCDTCNGTGFSNNQTVLQP